MSLETVPFDKQLTEIKRHEEKLRAAEGSFKAVFLLPNVFDRRLSYQNRLLTYQDWAVPASKPIQAPLLDFDRPVQLNSLEENPQMPMEEKPRFVFSYPLAGLLAIANIMTGLLGFYDKIPPVTLFYVIVLSVCVALSSLIMDFIHDWMRGKDKEKPASQEEQVKKAFAEMIDLFDKYFRYIKRQPQNADKLNQYKQLGTDPIIFSREAQLAYKLSMEVTKLSGVVMNICTENLQTRKDTIIFAMRDVQRAAVKV